MQPEAFVNRIATSVPMNDVHQFFIDFACSKLAGDPRRRAVFRRMAGRTGIEHRYSCISPRADAEGDSIDINGVFRRNDFPSTAKRMSMYAETAPRLAEDTVCSLLDAKDRSRITHLIVTTCTGFSAPGVDLEIVASCGLPNSVERTVIGFMGCYAAISALKQARHIVRSEPAARVLVVNVELCTLHLRETQDLEELLSFCIWGDGCAAALVSSDREGLRLDGFRAIVAHDSRDLMTWNIRDDGFEMVLSGQVPTAIHDTLQNELAEISGNRRVEDIDLWAVHPGGRSVLDAVERSLGLHPDALQSSRDVLRENGNMSSATVMFVLERMLNARHDRRTGCAMAFGPGLTAETMMFHTAKAA